MSSPGQLLDLIMGLDSASKSGHKEQNEGAYFKEPEKAPVSDITMLWNKLLCYVEEEVLKPWSDRESDFIVFACLDDDSFTQINMLYVLSALAFEKGDTPCLEEIFSAAVQLQDHPNTGILLNNLGVMFSESVLYDKSEECFTKAKRCFECKQDHTRDAVATVNLAALQKICGDYKKAWYFCEFAAVLCHDISMRTIKDVHLPGKLLRRVADLLEELGNDEKFRDILVIGVNFGIDGASKSSLADLIKWSMKIQLKELNGEKIDKEELKEFTSCLFASMDQPDAVLNVDFITTVLIAAKVNCRAGYTEEAYKLLEKLEATFHLDHGHNDPLYGSLLFQIGHFNVAFGRFAEAESGLKQATESSTHYFGKDHHTVALCKSLLGTCAVLQKNTRGASECLNEALTVFKKSNHYHPEVAKILFKCACFDVVECFFLSAKHATEEAMDVLSSSCGEASLKTAVGFIQSAVILQKDQSLRCSAVDKMEKGIALCYSGLGQRHHYPDVMVIHSLLGVLQLSLGRHKEAENCFIEVQKEASSYNEFGHVELLIIPEVMNLVLPVNSDENRSKCFCLRAQVLSLVNLVCMKEGDDRNRYLEALAGTLEEHKIDVLEIQDFAGQSLNVVAHRVPGLEKPAFCILFCDPSDSSKLILSCSNVSPCVLLIKSSSSIQEKEEFRNLDLALRESVSTLFLQSTIRTSYDAGRDLNMELIIPAGTGEAASLCSQIDCLPLLVALKLAESQEESVELNCLTSWPSSFLSESFVHVSYFSYQFLSHFAAECAFHHLISNVGKELGLDRMQVVETCDVPNLKNIAYFSFRENGTSSLSFGLDSQLPILNVKCRSLKESESSCVCLSVQNALVNTMKLCESHWVDFGTSVELPCEGVGIDCRKESASSSCGLENKPESSYPNVVSEKVELLSFMNSRDLESHSERQQSADIYKDAEAPSVSHRREKAHGSADVCLCLLDCLLSNRHVLPEEEPTSSSPLPSCGSNNQLDLSQSILSDGLAPSLSLLPISPSTCSECGPFMPNKSTSDNLPCVGKLKENGLLPVADETETGEVTSSKHLLEYPSTLYAENSGSREKLSEKPLPFSGALNLSSCQEGLTKREGNPDSEAKDPGHCEGFCHLQPKSSNEEHPSNYDHKGGTDVESEVVHFRELQSAQCHTVQVNPNQSAAWESVTQPSSSSTSVSQSSGAETLLNECGGPTFLRDEERAAFQHQIHELQEQVNQLEEQLKKSGTEKQQLQAELGRCLFLEDKGRRNQKLQLLSRESGSDQSRSCAGSASSTLTSMDGRLLGGAGPLQEPSSTLQARFLEISDSLSADELKRMKFLVRGKVNGFRLAKIREGFELFEELETGGKYPCAYIGQLLERVQRCDLLEKLGLPFPDHAKTGSEHLTEPQASLPSTDVLLGRREKEPLASNRTSHVSAHSEGDDGVSRSEQRDCEYNLYASVSSAGSSEVTDHQMSVGHVTSSNERLSLQNALNAGEQCPDSSDASLMSNSCCSSTVNSSDSLARSSQTTLSNCTSQGSPYSSSSLTSSNSLSATATSEMFSESGLNPTSSDEEIVRKSHHADNVSENGGLAEVGASAAKNEEREEQPVDSCDGVVRANKTDTRTCALGAEKTTSDVFVLDQASGTASFGPDQSAIERHSVGVSSASSTDWERLGARPKRVQAQCPPPDPAPQEIFSPAVSDGLTGDFLARHSQDKALHESLYRDDADISLFNDTPLQGASCIDGMINSSESNKAMPYLGACQHTSGTDPYSRLGNPSLHGPSNGFGRIGLLGGNSGVATAPLPRHLGGNYVSFHGNYSSSNGLNIGNSCSLQSNFVNNGSRFTGVENFSRDSYLPYEQRLGLALLNPGNQPVYSGMTGSGFPNYPSMGAVGYQPGHSVYSTQQSTVFSDNASTSTPRQDMRQTTQNASFTLGNQSNDTSNNAQTTSASAGNTGFVDVGNSGLPAPCSVSTCISSSSVVVSPTSSWPALACAGTTTLTVHNNDNDNNEIDVQGAAGGNVESSLAPYCSDANNDNSGGTILNRDFGTDSVESTDNSLLALEQRVSEACALVERVLREREEREQFGREIERKEQLIREQRERERREREERELQEAERWPQQQEAIAARSQWLCEHYQRHCRVRFPCCTQFYPCHRCHNNSRACDNEEAKACHATHLKCSHCQHEQQIDENSGKCAKCEGKMSAYFCSICKHFTSVDKNPYHCEKCGICRIHKDKSFHCEVCNVCLDKRLQGNHKCRPDSGHDECCICLEDAFSGCQILPCSHKVHRECAIAMIQNGIRTCPICRHPLYSPPRA